MSSLNSTAACILGILDMGPPPGDRDRWRAEPTMSAAEIWSTMERSVAGFWNMTRSQVYAELKRLAEQGLVDQPAAGRFALAATGREAARRWFTDFALDEPRDEQLRSPVALSVFFGHYLPKDLLERVVSEHRLRYQRRLDVLRTIEQAAPADRSLPGSTLKRAVLYLAGAVQWTEDVLARLRR